MGVWLQRCVADWPADSPLLFGIIKGDEFFSPLFISGGTESPFALFSFQALLMSFDLQTPSRFYKDVDAHSIQAQAGRSAFHDVIKQQDDEGLLFLCLDQHGVNPFFSEFGHLLIPILELTSPYDMTATHWGR